MASSILPQSSSPPATNGNMSAAPEIVRSEQLTNVWQARQGRPTPDPLPSGPGSHAPPTPSDAPHPDPFTIRYSSGPDANPSTNDPESWPEVGKLPPPAPTPTLPHPSPNGAADTSTESNGTNGTHRRSEKTKWVAIPAEELLAAADAARPRRAFGPQNQRGGNSGNRGSHSGSGSRATSTGRQNGPRVGAPSGPVSAAASTSASQDQSRATSRHSSPHGMARGRRLPDAGLPSHHAQPTPPPQQQHQQGPVGPNPYFDPSQSGYAYPNYPPGGFYPPYFAPPGGFSPVAGSQHSTPGYPLSPDGSFPPPPHNAYQTPPVSYGMYPQYPGYGYAPPYGFWAPPPPGASYPPPSGPHGPVHNQNQPHMSNHASPSPSISALALNIAPTVSHSDGSSPNIPPRAAHAKPGPPASSSALAGYREIEPLASPLVKASPVHFGTVGAPGSPQPQSPQALVLDDIQGLQKAFHTFSIGVKPGEPGPSSRLGTESVTADDLDTPTKLVFGTTDTASSSNATSADNRRSHGLGEEFTVRDFGYGFGATQPGAPPLRPPPPQAPHIPYQNRPQRGPQNDRGTGFPGRRPRGRSFRGGRGGGGGGGGFAPPPRFPSGTPPMYYPPLPGGIEYYPPPPNVGGPVPGGHAPMGYPGYDMYYPPQSSVMPIPAPATGSGGPASPAYANLINPPLPTTAVPFLDPTRTYLLGQLEYYLSAQNMAQDFYLRQQMDAEGFIPISLLASFNRIKTLTTDMILIRDMLVLSNQAELDYTHERVRMSGNQWVAYLLPPGHSGGQQANGSATDVVTPASGATEEEDDVEIVMNTDGAQS